MALGGYGYFLSPMSPSRDCLIMISDIFFPFFYMHDFSAIKMQEAYNIRKSWREQRVADVRNEKQVFRNMEKSLNSACQALTSIISKDEEVKTADRPHTAAEALEKVSTIIRASSAVPRSMTSGQSVTEMSIHDGWNFDPDSIPMTYHSNGPARPSISLPMPLGIASRPSTTLPPSNLPSSSAIIPRRRSVLDNRSMTAGSSIDGGPSLDVGMNNISLGAMPVGVSAGDSVAALEGLNMQLSQTLSTMVTQYKDQHMASLLRSSSSSSSASSALLQRAPPPDLSLRGAIGHPTSSSNMSNMAAMSTMARFTVREPMARIDSLNVPMRKAPNKPGMRLQDLEDIPSLVNGGFDPFMVISTSKNYRKVAKNQEAVAYLRLPKCARAKDTTKDNGAFFREASRQRSRESSGLGLGASEMSVEQKENAERGDGMVREWNQVLSEGLGLTNPDRLTLGGGLDDDDEMVTASADQEPLPDTTEPLGIAELAPSITSVEHLDDSVAADILSSNAPIRTDALDTAINKALDTTQHILSNTSGNPSTANNSTVNPSVNRGAQLEGSMNAASIIINNPGTYLFTSHCIVMYAVVPFFTFFLLFASIFSV